MRECVCVCVCVCACAITLLPTLSSREITLVKTFSIASFNINPTSCEQFEIFKDSFPMGNVSVLLQL